MALTPEQIKNLKPGDPLIIHCTFETLDDDGDICIKSPMTVCGRPYNDNLKYTHPSVVSIVKPKHDPCRKFKAGDVVEYVEVDGRDYKDAPPLGKQCRVFKEETDGFVVVTYLDFNCICRHEVPFYHLQLVTPVEELEQYSIDPANTNVLFKCGKKFATFEDDDEAQEVCDLLNEECRKEQNNENDL